MTTVSVIILAGNSQFNLGFPEILDKVGQFIAYGGFIAASVASFAVDNNTLKEEDNNNS